MNEGNWSVSSVRFSRKSCFQVSFHKALELLMLLIKSLKYSFINPDRHLEGANKQCDISSHEAFPKVPENVMHSKAFLDL